MVRPVLSECAMDEQLRVRRHRREAASSGLWEAAYRTGNWAAIAEAKALAETLRVAGIQAKRLAGIAEGLTVCADGILEPGHGRAA